MKLKSAIGLASSIAIAVTLTSAAQAQDVAAEAVEGQGQDADGVGGNVIIVTAQKREERLIDVPIAITALSSEALDDFKIEGGSELLRAVPNVNFSKSNFSMYNFSIRGSGQRRFQRHLIRLWRSVSTIFRLFATGSLSRNFSILVGSRCCADRRVRSMAEMPHPALSTSYPRCPNTVSSQEG